MCQWGFFSSFSRKKFLHTNCSGNSSHKNLRGRKKLTENIFIPYNHSCLLVLQNRTWAEGKPNKGRFRMFFMQSQTGKQKKSFSEEVGLFVLTPSLSQHCWILFHRQGSVPSSKAQERVTSISPDLLSEFLRGQRRIFILYARVSWINFMEGPWETTEL